MKGSVLLGALLATPRTASILVTRPLAPRPSPCCPLCDAPRPWLLGGPPSSDEAGFELPWLLSSSSDGEGGPVSRAAVSFLRWYKQAMSPLLPPGCRFVPTCSEYAIASFQQFSPPQALVLMLWRIIRCNPLHLEGYGTGVDEPTWPPPAYWAGDGTVRTVADDERSRRRALGEEVADADAEPLSSQEMLESDDPFGKVDEWRRQRGSGADAGD